jgi:tetratricopeptide (TPR) repeat protein
VAKIALRTGDLRMAVEAGERALASADEAGYQVGEVSARTALAEASRRLGEHRQARLHLDAGMAHVDRGVALMQHGQLLVESGRLFLAEGDLRRARETAERSVAMLAKTGQRLHHVRALRLLVSVLDAAGEPDEVDRWWAVAHDLLAGSDLPDGLVARELPSRGGGAVTPPRHPDR